jgi:hypothetical protein
MLWMFPLSNPESFLQESALGMSSTRHEESRRNHRLEMFDGMRSNTFGTGMEIHGEALCGIPQTEQRSWLHRARDLWRNLSGLTFSVDPRPGSPGIGYAAGFSGAVEFT